MFKLLLAKTIGFGLNGIAFFSRDTAIQHAFTLFSTPRKGRYTDEDKAVFDGSETKYLDVGDSRFAYHHWSGSKGSILFCHGWESNTARWQPYIDLLRQSDITIYSIDAPAHGDSSGKTISAVLYAAGIDAVCQEVQPDIIMGHSLGGMALGYYAKAYPTTAKEIILMSTPSGLVDMTLRYFDIIGLSHGLLPDMIQYFSDHFDLDARSFSTAMHLKDCPTPGLIIHDQSDDVTPYPESLEIAEAWPAAQHKPTHHLGHSLRDQDFIHEICAYISGRLS